MNSNGSIDTGFGQNGFATQLIGNTFFSCMGLAIQADNKIVAAGSAWNGSDYDLAAVRFTENGTLDNTFSSDGISSKNFAGTNEYAYAIDLLADGRIVVVGKFALTNTSEMMVMRLNTDGTIDNSLIPNGASTLTFSQGASKAMDIAHTSDNTMWLAGSVYNGLNWDIAIGKMTFAGQYDGTFGNKGTLIVPIGNYDDYGQQILIQPDGKVIIGGYTESETDDDFVLIRLNANGTFDNTFNQTGILKYSISPLGDACYSMAFQSNGKLIASGEAKNSNGWDFTIARFLTEMKVGVIDFVHDSQFLVYPNPIKNNSVLEFSLVTAECLTISVFSSEGKLVRRIMDNKNLAAGTYNQPLDDLNALSSGNYLIVFDNGISKHTLKISK